MRKPWLLRLAPEGWLQQHLLQHAPAASAAPEDAPQLSVSSRESPSAPWSLAVSPETARDWARLLAKVYEVDVLRCSRCGSPMKVLAVIKNGVAPPGLEASSLN